MWNLGAKVADYYLFVSPIYNFLDNPIQELSADDKNIMVVLG